MTIFGGFRTLWIIAMFDLPTDTAYARRCYTQFRQELLKDGFIMMQFSVYARHCASEENAVVHKKRIQLALPPKGEIRVVTLTDKQYERMDIFWGKSRGKKEAPPEQISFF